MAHTIGLRGFGLAGERYRAGLARFGVNGRGIVVARIENEDALRHWIVHEAVRSIRPGKFTSLIGASVF